MQSYLNEFRAFQALEPPPDYVAFVGLLFAMVAMILRNKTMAWVGLGLGISSLTQFNWRTSDIKQITSAIVFSSAGLIAAYASPKNVH